MIWARITLTVERNGRLLRDGKPLEFGDEFQGCELAEERDGERVSLPREFTFKFVELECSPAAEDWRRYTLERIA